MTSLISDHYIHQSGWFKNFFEPKGCTQRSGSRLCSWLCSWLCSGLCSGPCSWPCSWLGSWRHASVRQQAGGLREQRRHERPLVQGRAAPKWTVLFCIEADFCKKIIIFSMFRDLQDYSYLLVSEIPKILQNSGKCRVFSCKILLEFRIFLKCPSLISLKSCKNYENS